MKLFVAAFGGALGTLCRYAIGEITKKLFHVGFPWGTLFVNGIGSFVIGFLWGTQWFHNDSSTLKTFVFIGILGGFTTFSSFSLDTLNLFRNNQPLTAILNIAANNLMGLSLAALGYWLSNFIATKS